MNTTGLTLIERTSRDHAHKEEIINFYNEASVDYRHWSKDLNMHFGYFRLGKTNPFRRDSMLNELNDQVYKRLALKNTIQRIADLGCGLGGTMRRFLQKNTKLFAFGVTISPFQVNEGNRLLNNFNGIICEESYENTTFGDDSLDGAVAIESFCHAGHSKTSFKEAYRILKPGKRLVIADAFIKKDFTRLYPVSRWCYDSLCKGWSLKGIGNIDKVTEDLRSIGFRKVIVEDISMRVAPSVFHVPFAVISFILKNLMKGQWLGAQSFNNLKGSVFALLSGLHRTDFSYYMVTAIK